MANTSAMDAASDTNNFLALGGSFNLYMAYGGSSFAFWAGANGGGTSYSADIQSYDYDAPIAEGGGHGYGADGDKYSAIRTVLAYWADGPLPAEPPAPAVTAYGAVPLGSFAPLDAPGALAALVPGGPLKAARATNMEALNISRGWALYRTAAPVTARAQARVAVAAVSDLALVRCVDAASGAVAPVGWFWRPNVTPLTAPPGACTAPSYVDVLLEDYAHINYSHGMDDDVKGFRGLTVDGQGLDAAAWQVYPLELRYSDGWPARLPWTATPAGAASAPAFYRGTLAIAGAPTDTYLATCGWGHGAVWINGFELGRYWDPQGPQHTLYVPAPVLRTGNNEVLLWEANATAGATVHFVAAPDFTGAGCKALLGGAAAAAAPPAVVLDARAAAAGVRRGLSHAEARAAASMEHGAWLRSRQSPPSRRLAAAATAAACGAPAAGTNLTLQDCATVGAAAQWTLVPPAPGIVGAGRFQAAADASLCIGVLGTNPDTGSPNLAAVPCVAPGSRAQDWITFPDNGHKLMSALSGAFMDVPNSDSNPGARLETYANNGGYDNQRFVWDAAAGTLTSGLASNLCVAVCA